MALADQASAANADAARIMHFIAGVKGERVQQARPGPVSAALISRMHQRGVTAQLTLCPHLSYDAPQPAFWCAWAPGRLRCTDCAHKANARVRGTPEDRRCDHCRKIGRTIHADMAQLPPVVVDLPGGAKCLPPITVMFGLCPDCQRQDQAARPGATTTNRRMP